MQTKLFKHNFWVNDWEPEKYETGDGKRYYKLPNGTWAPSVTTILGYFKKKSLEDWEDRVGSEQAENTRRHAALRGKRMHKMIEMYLCNERMFNILEIGSLQDQGMFKRMIPTLNRINNIRAIEYPIYLKPVISTHLPSAGQIDLVADFDGSPAIIDFKTSLRPKKKEWITDYFLQETAYFEMCVLYNHVTNIGSLAKIITIIANDEDEVPQVFVESPWTHIAAWHQKIEEYYKCVPWPTF